MVGEDKLGFEGVSAQHLARKVFAEIFSKKRQSRARGRIGVSFVESLAIPLFICAVFRKTPHFSVL